MNNNGNTARSRCVQGASRERINMCPGVAYTIKFPMERLPPRIKPFPFKILIFIKMVPRTRIAAFSAS